MDREEMVRYVNVIVETFCWECPEALPDPESVSGETYEREKRMQESIIRNLHNYVLPRVGTEESHLAYTYFGRGPVAIFFEWRREIPQFRIGVWRRDGIRCNAPWDQAHRTWQRLLAKCEEKGLDREWLRLFIEFKNN